MSFRRRPPPPPPPPRMDTGGDARTLIRDIIAVTTEMRSIHPSLCNIMLLNKVYYKANLLQCEIIIANEC